MKKRVLVIANSYPHVTHSYINNDVEYLDSRAEVLVLSKRQPSAPYYSPVNFNYFDTIKQLEVQARQFRPDYIICWLMPNHFLARRVTEVLDVPFVLKLHTPDVFRITAGRGRVLDQLKAWVYGELRLSRSYRVLMQSLKRTAHSPQLRAVFCIPALREVMSGIFPSGKLLDMQPWFFYERFHNEALNGDNLLVLGSLLNRRENNTTFADTLVGIDATIDWIPVPTPGCLWLDIPGIPPNLRIRKYLPNAELPALYKTYKGMIVIGRGKYSRGLSMSLLEAQASGVAVIAPSLRPDYDRFVTDGGGFIFRHEREIPAILQNLPDPARREMGFRHAANYGAREFERQLTEAGLPLD